MWPRPGTATSACRAPCGARGSKHDGGMAARGGGGRAPCGARGSKHGYCPSTRDSSKSRPVRGARIETSTSTGTGAGGGGSRPVRGARIETHRWQSPCAWLLVAPRAGRADRNTAACPRNRKPSLVAPRAGRADRNTKSIGGVWAAGSRAPCGARGSKPAEGLPGITRAPKARHRARPSAGVLYASAPAPDKDLCVSLVGRLGTLTRNTAPAGSWNSSADRT
jgi:hypothetical protein